MTIPPFLSVIVPAYNAAHDLDITLSALLASDIPRRAWELIVVDDASTDDTALIAAKYADTVVRLSGRPHGPAYARNRGFEASRGDNLVFTDADVTVHPDALGLIAHHLAVDEDLAAAFGSYDDQPTHPSIVSRYRNLMHTYVHHQNAGEALTFWAGLGAIRRSVFRDADGFDEWHYHRPQIEDIEIGRRIRRLGYRIKLVPEIQGTHRKRWTFGQVVKTDFQHRGVPWMWLILREGVGSGEKMQALNVRPTERICTALVWVALLALLALPLLPNSAVAGAIAVTLTVVAILNRGFYKFLWGRGGFPLTISSIGMHWIYYIGNGFSAAFGWLMHVLLGSPPPRADAAALAQIGVKSWPPVPRQARRGIWSPDE